MKNLLQIIIILITMLIGSDVYGQNNGVTIGGSETRTDAVLWLIPSGNDGQQGLVLPQTIREGFIPTIEGMIIFDPTDQTIYVWSGTEWEALGAGGTGTADDWGNQTVVSDSILTGSGTVFDPLTIASQDAGLGQVLKWNGTSWAPALDETGATGSSVNSINEITGDGTSASPLQLDQQAAEIGQILKWDGTSWTPAEDLNGGSGTIYIAGEGIIIDGDNTIINTGDGDADSANELQTLSFDIATNELSLSDGNSISIPTGGTDADADPTNEIQTISFDNVTNELSLTEGGSVIIPAGGDDADADPTNEIQMLSFDPATNELTLSNGNTIIIPTGGTDADADPTNEIQDLSLSGTNLEITGGASVDLAPLIPPGGTDDQNLIVTGSVLTIEGGSGTVDLSTFGDADADPSNEIQTISFDAATNELSLTSGGSVTIPTGGTDADADPTNEIQDLILAGTTLNISGGMGVDLAAIIPPGGTDDQNLVIAGDVLSIEGGAGTIDLSAYGDDADADPTNEIQTISYDELTGEVELTDGGSFILTSTGSGAFESIGGVVSPMDNNEDDFVFGSDQLDDDPASSDDDYKMLFDKSTGSFRAGRSESDQWDSANRGDYSLAAGLNNIASGQSSIALGDGNEATEWASIALGYETLASGQDATAMGSSTIASGNRSTAIGSNTEATNSNSTAMGNQSEATGTNSTAMGYQTQANETNATAMGNSTLASGINSLAMGHNTVASGDVTTALGLNTRAESYASVALGRFNIGGGNVDSWQTNDKVFEIGNGTDDGNRNNAFTVLKNGFVGIGEAIPNGSLIIGKNFAAAYANLPELTIGGTGEGGGIINLGNEQSRMEIFSTPVLDAAIIAYDDSEADGKGDLFLRAKTVNIGQNADGIDYILNVNQDGNFGKNFANGDKNWESFIFSSTGSLSLYTDGSLDAIGTFNYASGDYSSMSDRNSKEDINPLKNVLLKVGELEPLRYKFINEKNNKKSLGFIAQDVKEIFPELVTFSEGREGSEGNYLMNYSGFGVVAIAAIQEQQVVIENQEEEIELLKTTLEQLLERVECLETK